MREMDLSVQSKGINFVGQTLVGAPYVCVAPAVEVDIDFFPVEQNR